MCELRLSGIYRGSTFVVMDGGDGVRRVASEDFIVLVDK